MILNIPVKPYSLRFLTNHLGNSYELSKLDVYGLYLYAILRTPRGDKRYDSYLGKYSKQFSVELSPDLVENCACTQFSSLTIIRFNKFVEKMFNADLYSFVELYIGVGYPIQKALLKFQEKNRLTEEDISTDHLHKKYQRERAKARTKHKPKRTPRKSARP